RGALSSARAPVPSGGRGTRVRRRMHGRTGPERTGAGEREADSRATWNRTVARAGRGQGPRDPTATAGPARAGQRRAALPVLLPRRLGLPRLGVPGAAARAG